MQLLHMRNEGLPLRWAQHIPTRQAVARRAGRLVRELEFAIRARSPWHFGR